MNYIISHSVPNIHDLTELFTNIRYNFNYEGMWVTGGGGGAK